MPESGYIVFHAWICTAWPASCRALCAALCIALCTTLLNCEQTPPFVGMSRNAAHNVLHDAAHNALHDAGHAVQNHVLKVMYPDLAMPKPWKFEYEMNPMHLFTVLFAKNSPFGEICSLAISVRLVFSFLLGFNRFGNNPARIFLDDASYMPSSTNMSKCLNCVYV